MIVWRGSKNSMIPTICSISTRTLNRLDKVAKREAPCRSCKSAIYSLLAKRGDRALSVHTGWKWKQIGLPGNLLLVGVFTNDVFDEFYPFINVTRIDDNRSRYDVAERVHPDLLVEVKDFHRKIALEPETLAV